MGRLPVSGRRMAVLGDMLELGPDERKMHRAVGEIAGRVLQRLVTVGDLGRDIAMGARQAGMAAEAVVSVQTREDAAAQISAWVGPGDVVLVKASRGMRLDEVVRLLTSSDRAS